MYNLDSFIFVHTIICYGNFLGDQFLAHPSFCPYRNAMQSIMAFLRLFMLHGISKLRVLQTRHSFKLFIHLLVSYWRLLKKLRDLCDQSTLVGGVDDGFTSLVDIQSLARDLCDLLPLWVYDEFCIAWHSISYKGFTWSTLLNVWWIYLGRHSISCKGFMWSTLVSLRWILHCLTFNLLQLKHQNCIQSSYEDDTS